MTEMKHSIVNIFYLATGAALGIATTLALQKVVRVEGVKTLPSTIANSQVGTIPGVREDTINGFVNRKYLSNVLPPPSSRNLWTPKLASPPIDLPSALTIAVRGFEKFAKSESLQTDQWNIAGISLRPYTGASWYWRVDLELNSSRSVGSGYSLGPEFLQVAVTMDGVAHLPTKEQSY